MGILSRENALANAESRRVELSENALSNVENAVAIAVEKAIKEGKMFATCLAEKGFKSIKEVREYLTPILEELGYDDYEITSTPSRKHAWVKVNFESKEQ